MEITKNKRVLITGATGELGTSIAKEMHKQGHEIFLSGTKTEIFSNLAGALGPRTFLVLLT